MNKKEKKAIMLRTDKEERITNIKNDYKKIEGVTLTTENIFDKGIEYFEKQIFNKKAVKLANPELSVSQISMLKDAIKNGMDMKYIDILSKEKFSSGLLSVLIEVALEKYDIKKFKEIAKPKIKTGKASLIIECDQKLNLPIELFKKLANPEMGYAQIGVLTDACYKNKNNFELIEQTANPKLNVAKMATILSKK